jgi:predicted PhzF superfamily epimerase YddE/YHI9
MHLPFATLDVFTPTRYLGNPLAVIRVPASLRTTLTEAQKQKIAKEFNLSEVTFLHENQDEEGILDFDIFTSIAHIAFAGHPTIGTAIYVATHPEVYPGVRKLRTLAGLIPFEYDEGTGRATVGIPHDVHIHRKCLSHPNEEGEDGVPIVSIVKGMAFGLCKMADLKALGAVSGPLLPPQDRYKCQYLDEGSGWDTGPTGSFYFVDQGTDGEGVRMLRTRAIPAFEDPGTGSASAALCSYLCLTEGGEGRKKFHLTQGVEMGRRCDIFIDVKMKVGNKEVDEVMLSGGAIEVMEGTLTVE